MDFCNFYDSNALESDAIKDEMFICVECNDELDRNAFSFVDWDTIKSSRDMQMPGSWN